MIEERNEINDANLLALGFKWILNDMYCIRVSNNSFVQVRRKKGVWHLYECENYTDEIISGGGSGSLKNVCLHTYKVNELSDVANRLNKILENQKKDYQEAIDEINQQLRKMSDYFLKYFCSNANS